MGIKQLMKLISEEAPKAVKELQLPQLTGRQVALDASMALYQFLIAVRSNDGTGPQQMLTNEAGEVTSHIQGIFNRTIRLMDSGIKPIFVFDGKPPTMKSGELAKRTQRRQEAEAGLLTAQAEGTAEDIEKFSKRLVRVTPQHNEEVKELLHLMGVPVIEAPCEAEATCAALARAGKVYAAGTEDMDALTFQSPVLLRRLTFSANKKLPLLEIKLDAVLEGLELTIEQFVDLCILCGCDYCESIKGIGPKKALSAIREHKSIEKYLDVLKTSCPKGVVIPDNWLSENPIYVDAREMFLKPEVVDTQHVELKWKDPQEEELKQLLVNKHGFNAERVTSALEKLKKAKTKHSQKRLDSFFSVLPSKPGVKRNNLKKVDPPAKKSRGKAKAAK